MKSIRHIGLTLLTFFTLSACEQDEILRNSEYMVQSQYSEKTVDPVIEKYSAYGNVTLAPENYQGSSIQCTSPIAIYILVPDYGPFAGTNCEIYRYQSPKDIEGPCGDEYNLNWRDDEIGGYKTIACPESGENCAEIDGVNGCRLVHCDEPE